jgi:hypothetical protein
MHHVRTADPFVAEPAARVFDDARCSNAADDLAGAEPIRLREDNHRRRRLVHGGLERIGDGALTARNPGMSTRCTQP